MDDDDHACGCAGGHSIGSLVTERGIRKIRGEYMKRVDIIRTDIVILGKI